MTGNKPLSLIIEDAKLQTVRAVNQVRAASGLPAYLFEGILTSILIDIKEEKNYEISHDFSLYKAQLVEENSKQEEVSSEVNENGEH